MSRELYSKVAVGVSGLLVLSVLVQATIAGQWLNGSSDIQLHGYIGNGSFLLGMILAVAVFLAKAPGWLHVCAGAAVLLLFAQTGLGYIGRDSIDARMWHIPMGVATFGVCVACLTGALLMVAQGKSEQTT
jgi:hypothetical protein